jgi:acetyl-CoA C-acetyltransferase
MTVQGNYQAQGMIEQAPKGFSWALFPPLKGQTQAQAANPQTLSVAAQSQHKAATAIDQGRFHKEIVPVMVPTDGGEPRKFDRDEHVRPGTTVETLAALRPSFKEDGLMHAGNSSGIVDGAAAVLVGSEAKGRALGLTPRARIVATALSGADPTIMLTGPMPATRKALARAGMRIDEIDLFEVNEAFAAVPLKFMKELGVPHDKVNVNGGAIAMGHPLGATGAMLLGTLVDELHRRRLRYGLVTLCVGGGMGIATIVETI